MSVLDDPNADSSTHLHTLEAIDSSRDDIDMRSNHSKVKVDITPINSTNYTTCSSQNQDANIDHNFIHFFIFHQSIIFIARNRF